MICPRPHFTDTRYNRRESRHIRPPSGPHRGAGPVKNAPVEAPSGSLLEPMQLPDADIRRLLREHRSMEALQAGKDTTIP